MPGHPESDAAMPPEPINERRGSRLQILAYPGVRLILVGALGLIAGIYVHGEVFPALDPTPFRLGGMFLAIGLAWLVGIR